MSKRAVLWMVGIIAFGFTFLAALNASIADPIFTESMCGGFEELDRWFDDYCSELLPTRLAVMSLGLIVLLVCGYFAEKSDRGPELVGGHRLRRIGSAREWRCLEPECGFVAYSRQTEREHRIETGGRLVTSPPTATPPATTDGFGGVGTQAIAAQPPPPATPTTVPPVEDSKMCPDCAEQVRSAARKCRFCGHRFAESTVGATQSDRA
jgi:Uncharacterised protein family UPF0547